MTKVALIILHYKAQKLTADCLASVVKLAQKDYVLEITVINNNPTQDLTDLARRFKSFNFIATDRNLGFTGGNNYGFRQALTRDPDWLMLLNNDTVVDQDLVTNLLAAARSDPQAGVLGPMIYFAPGYEYDRNRYRPQEKGRVIWYAGGVVDWQNVYGSHRGVDEVDIGQYNRVTKTDFVSGCAMLISRAVVDRIGLLDDRYFMYLEDNDYCQRAKRAGFKVFFVPDAKVWHANAASSAIGGNLQDYFLTRNRLLFGLKYAPRRTKLALVKESARLLVAGRPWQRIGVRDFYIRRFGRGSWGDN